MTSRSPLGQAGLVLERRRVERERRRLALDPGATSTAQAVALVLVAIAFVAWAATRALL